VPVRDLQNTTFHDTQHGRTTVGTLSGHAGYGRGMSPYFATRALLTRPGYEHGRLLLWRRDMQRRYGLLRRKVRKQVGYS
jgi:hypothetical protein